MDLLNHVVGILTKPKNEWSVIKEEPINTIQLFKGYIAILALVPAIAYIIGNCIIGIKIPLGPSSYAYKVPIFYGIIYAIVTYIMAFVGIYLSAFIINALAPNFESTQNMNNALKLITFSYTPVWIASIFSIYTPLYLLGFILSLYGLYILYIGLEPMMGTSAQKRTVYFIVTILVVIIVFAVVGIIVSMSSFTPAHPFNY